MSDGIVEGIKRSPETHTDDELPSPKRPEYDEVQEVTVDAEISLPTTEVATEQDSTGVMMTRSDSPTNSYANVSGTMYSPQNMVNFQTSPAAISNALEMLMQMQQAFNQKMGQQSGSQQAHSPGQSSSQDAAESGGQSSAPVYLMVPSGTPEYLQGSRPLAPRREGEATSAKVVSDREMQRKASHNEVERRRRERINELTRSLAKLIPACQKETTTTGKVGSASLNKGFVLEKAIEYIKELHTLNGQLGELVKTKEQAHNALQVLQGQITILEKENEFLRFQLKQLSMQPPTSQHGSLSQLILQGLSKSGLKGEEAGAAVPALSNTSSPTPSSIHLTPTGTPSSSANGVQSSPAAYQPSTAASTTSTNLYLNRDLLPQLVESARNSQNTPEKTQSNPEPTVEEPTPPQTAGAPAQ